MAAEDAQLREAQEKSYALRSLFFYRALQNAGLSDLFISTGRLNCEQYDFADFTRLGILPAAASYLQQQNILICHVFCHPDVIRSNPHLILYYRGAAALSQKGLKKLAGFSNLKQYEQGTNKRPLSVEVAQRISRVLNTLINPIVTNVMNFRLELLRDQVLMTIGPQTLGSWVNRIGIEASTLVKEMILRDLLTNRQLVDAVSLEEIMQQREFTLVNGYHIRFGSEPDISILRPDGVIEEAAIEVKGSLDEAGALTRYGEAKKSFDAALTRNPSVITVYLASVITHTVAQRIATDRAVKESFNLTDILVEGERERFLNQLYWWAHLQR